MASIANVKLPAGAAGVHPRLVDEMSKSSARFLRRYDLIPETAHPASHLRKYFFEQMKAVSKRNEVSEQDDDDDGKVGLDSDDTDLGPIKELDQELWDIIDGSFSHLLWASVGTYTKLLGGKIHNEAEAHHNWDAVLDLGFVVPGEVASARLL
ncbi:hypothetical protein ARMSODRAFT_1020198 [Armillaria solidipes]|uniref:Uncharacterized protein n=1 Tax=Armillaria solidipes TaxID=1076256 RepID=A0A2H3BX91_9AGAR|nr:hypothetical protein ARMSODRAFT_1020198 [Armillaria solidipes]